MAVKTFTDNTSLPASDINTYLNNGGLVWIKSTTVGSAVSTVTVTSAFSADYDSYRIAVRGITPSAQDSFMIMLGSGATTNHYSSMYYDLYSGGSTGTVRTNNTGKIYCALNENGNTNSAFVIDVHNPYLAVATQVHGTWAGRAYQGWSGGFNNLNTSYTSFTICTDGAGTMTGGTIQLYGYRKA